MLEIFIVIYGIATSLLSLCLGVYFYQLKSSISTAIALMAWGAAIAGLCTLIFSVSSLLNVYSALPDLVQALLRLGIYTGITGADIYMLYKIRQINK